MNKKLWFKAKSYGFGWTPSSWEGWLVIVIFFLFQVWNFMRIDAVSQSGSDTLRPFIIQMVISVIVLFAISYWKGENPKWRWGKKDE